MKTPNYIVPRGALEPLGALISFSDLPMDKYLHRLPPQPQQQQKKLADCRRRKPFMEDDRGNSTPLKKKMRIHNDKDYFINNHGSNSNFPQGRRRSGRTSRSPSPGFDHLAVASINAHKFSPSGSVFNWRLACFMAREYLSRGTLLGKQWPPQDSNTSPREDAAAEQRKNLREDEAASEREALYSTLTTDFLRSEDIHIPGIVNPAQMAAWFGLI